MKFYIAVFKKRNWRDNLGGVSTSKDRIEDFCKAQKEILRDVDIEIMELEVESTPDLEGLTKKLSEVSSMGITSSADFRVVREECSIVAISEWIQDIDDVDEHLNIRSATFV